MRICVSVSSKLLIMLIASGVSAALTVGALGYYKAQDALKTAIDDQLVAIRESKKADIVRYFEGQERMFQVFASQRQLQDAADALAKGFAAVALARHFWPGLESLAALGAVIGFMVWLWISVITMLMGAELDAQGERQIDFAMQDASIEAADEARLAEDLRQQSFIVREQGSGTRSAMEAFFNQARFQPHLTMELQSNDAIKQAVKANLGVSFLSQHTIALELQTEQLCILDVNGAPMVRAWNVVHMLSKMLSPAAEAFRYFILEHAERYLAGQFGEMRQPKN